jgi:hypothetical protein
MTQPTTGEMAVTSAGRVTSKLMEEDCSFRDVSEFRSIAIPDFEGVSPT